MTGRRTLALSLVTGCAWLACEPPRQEKARPVEPRLTETAVYKPCRIDETASDLVPDAICGQRAALKARIPPVGGEAVRGAGTPAAFDGTSREVGLGDLLADGGLDELKLAVRRLEETVAAEPHDARAWSDLAAVYLVRAQRADEPRDLLRAFQAASRAVREDGSLREARFNQALTLERLFLRDAARAAWQSYRELDDSSAWAEEAARRKEALGRPLAKDIWDRQEKRLDQAALAGNTDVVASIVDRYRQAAREYAEHRLFGAWADAVLAGRPDLAADRRRVLEAIGEALLQTSGEHLVHDSVIVIGEAAGDPLRWQDLVKGTRDFRDGLNDYYARNLQRAALKLGAAREALTRAGSPLALRAAFFLASGDYISQRYSRAVTATERLLRQIRGKHYGALRGHAYWIKAVAEATLARTRESLEDYAGSAAEFRRLGEEENAVSVDCLLADLLLSRGRAQEAWRYIYQALRGSPKLRNPDKLVPVFIVAGNAALQEAMDEAALAFTKERVRQARLSNPLATVEALTWLAQFQYRMGDRRGAFASLLEAEGRLADVEESLRPRRKTDLAMIKGLMMEKENPREAVDLLTPALSAYEKENNLIFSLSTLLSRARAYRRSGEDDRAERDLDAALQVYDRMGHELEQEDLRLALLEEADSAFDEMVDLQFREDPERAFAYADRAHSRVLPGSASKLWIGGPSETSRLLATEPEPLTLKEIEGRLPKGTTLVQFAVLQDRVLIWRLRRDARGFFERHIRREDLNERVARLQAFDAKDWNRAADEMFDLLIRPWLSTTATGERIVIVPDKVLHRVPFAALWDSSTRSFLIQSHPLAFAPSATLYVNAIERQSSQRGERSSGLVIGEPAIDRSRFVDLSSLPAAKEEALRLAKRTGARLLTGEGADKASFLGEAPTAEWIQFAGHAVVEPGNTLLSKLVLAPGADGDSGVLTAREIYSLQLHDTRLVVLAACETGNQYVPGGEGVTSLARAFLAAGVPTVVASLWSVDDGATARLFDSFHHHLLSGGDAVDALRAAQLAMLGSRNEKDRSPRAWAAFEVIGASAEGRL